jgi:head-tail adaptor
MDLQFAQDVTENAQGPVVRAHQKGVEVHASIRNGSEKANTSKVTAVMPM